MRKIIIAAVMLLIILSGSAGSAKKIVNPSFKSRTSSVLTIDEMELGKKETKVKFRAVFRPGWAFTVSDQAYLLDPETGKKFYPRTSEGLTFGKSIVMPESGDTTFTLTYPPIPKNTKILDFSPNSVFHTFGISLSDKKSSKEKLEDQLTETPRKPTPYFFKGGDVRIHGKIKGYDPRLGFDSFQLLSRDVISGKATIALLSLDSCGNFDQTIYIPAPNTAFMTITPGMNVYQSIYLEPDNDIEILFDWEDILDYDRQKGLKSKLDNVRFGGSLAEINRASHNAPEKNYISGAALVGKFYPSEAKDIISSEASRQKTEIERYADEINASSFIRKYLLESVQSDEAMAMMDYDHSYFFNHREYPDSAIFMLPIPKDFYDDFLPPLLKADTTILATHNAVFLLNGLSYSYSLPEALSLENNEYGWFSNYQKLDSVIWEWSGLPEIPFIWQASRTANNYSKIVNMAKWNPNLVRKNLEELYSISVKSPYLIKKLEDCFSDVLNSKRYDLPPTPGGDIMRELIKPFRGKWIIVDFWGISCGPCRSNIESSKEFRELNRNNEYFTYLFITGEDESPNPYYDNYVEKNLKGENSHRLKLSDIRAVRSLFGIDGIPRYILIDPDGLVADDDFFNYELSKFLERENIPYKSPESKRENDNSIISVTPASND